MKSVRAAAGSARRAGAAVLLAAAACAPATPASVPAPDPPGGTLRGTVTYRERMALPADAVVDVWITDVSPGVTIQVLTGEARVETKGRPVPIPFEVAFDRARLAPDHDYAVKAAIRAGDETLFESVGNVLVLTKGRPSSVALVLAKPGGTDRAADALTGTSWTLAAVGGAPALAGVAATLEFPEAGRAAGKASCNRFSGAVTVAGSSLRFGALAVTRMACPGGAMEQESKVLAAFHDAERFELRGGELLVFAKAAEPVLRFSPSPR